MSRSDRLIGYGISLFTFAVCAYFAMRLIGLRG